MRYQFIQSQVDHHAIHRLCHIMQVSKSGYYDDLHHALSQRAKENTWLAEQCASIHHASHHTLW